MENNKGYAFQDRGTKHDYDAYLAAMDAISVEKVASASVFFDPAPGNTIVDIGMASGTSSDILANLFPHSKIIGVDINPKMVEIARETYLSPNLEFRIDDGEKLKSFDNSSVDGFFNCSSIHHITSFNGYEPNKAFNTLKRQTEILKDGGILVVRDFVKPVEKEVIIELCAISKNGEPSNADLLVEFSKTARALSDKSERGFPLKELISPNKDVRRFQLFYSDAVEFIRRKDYYDNWEIELQEEYGYFTQKEFESIYAELGLRVIISYPIYNPWIVKNRYRHQFSLYDINLNDIGFPPTNYLIAGEKIKNKGTSIHLIRYLPVNDNSFLKFNSFRNVESNQVYDVVQRPNSVVDILPYCIENGNIEIVAKHSYPRPIVNIETGPNIDQKYYSGYIIEGLTAAYSQSIGNILEERAGIDSSCVVKTEQSMVFYTSPGGIDEKIESFHVELKLIPIIEKINRNISGFVDSGSVRRYNALQLLRTAQTGALVEARLELNVYNLFRKHALRLPPWLGECIEVEEREIIPSNLKELLAVTEKQFEHSDKSADYLQTFRAKFTEAGVANSSNILEFVTPRNFSNNTLLTLPVAKFKGEVYLGLEVRNLPVPQIHSGNSNIPVAPAMRLSREIKNYCELENCITSLKFQKAVVASFHKLGEKFYPSVGVTPEQVYPYVVTLKGEGDNLKWVSLRELYNNLESLRDGHLLISVVRLAHALEDRKK